MAWRTTIFFLNITKENKQTNEQKEKFYDKPETFPTRFGLVTSHNKIHCLCLRTQAQSRYLCIIESSSDQFPTLIFKFWLHGQLRENSSILLKFPMLEAGCLIFSWANFLSYNCIKVRFSFLSLTIEYTFWSK